MFRLEFILAFIFSAWNRITDKAFPGLMNWVIAVLFTAEELAMI